jgi:putative permease
MPNHNNLKRERRLKLTAFFAVLVAALVVVLAVENMLLSFVLAFVLNYLLTPLIDRLESARVPRQMAILIPFFSAAFLIAFGIYKILPLMTAQAAALEASLPHYQTEFLTLVTRTEQRFKLFFSFYHIDIGLELNSWLLRKTAAISAALPDILQRTLTVSLLAPLFAFFMLQDGRRVNRSLLQMVPNNHFEMAIHLQNRINEQLGNFIRARFLEALIVGLVVLLGLELIGFPYAGLLALFAAVVNLIPYIGPLIGAVPALIIALVADGGMVAHSASLSLMIVAAVYLLAQIIDVLLVIPLVVARVVNLHPVTVIIVIIIGAQLMGILGMVISIPVASVLKLTLSTVYDHLMETQS